MAGANNNHQDQIDVLEELKAEKSALEREVPLLRMVLNSLPASVYAKDASCKFLLVNDAVVRKTGGEILST